MTQSFEIKKKDTGSTLNRLFQIIRISSAIAFYLFIIAATLKNLPKAELQAHPTLLQNLLSGSTQAYLLAGSEFEPFKPFLPEYGTFTWIVDDPFDRSDEKARRFYWGAGNYLCPIILNGYPGENRAIVFCSTQLIANQRLRETGYRWTKVIASGKGLAEKI